MEVAAKNLQKELVDVNNLWHWPTDVFLQWKTPESIFEAPFNKWVVIYGGYISSTIGPGSGHDDIIFSEETVSSRRDQNSYAAGVFLRLVPGSYTLSFDADSAGEWLLHDYFFQEDQKTVKYMGSTTPMSFQTGRNSIRIDIEDGVCRVFSFYGIPKPWAVGEWVTLTNIKLRDGVL